MSELKRIDQILTRLKRRQDRGRMTYQKAVDIEALISAFEHIRGVVIAETEKPSLTPLMSDTAFDVMLRGLIG